MLCINVFFDGCLRFKFSFNIDLVDRNGDCCERVMQLATFDLRDLNAGFQTFPVVDLVKIRLS